MRKIDRFIKYMSYKGLNDNQVTRECELSQGLLNQARSGKSDLGSKTIDKILTKYQDLNRVWLLTGEGEMLKNSKNTSLVAEPLREYNTEHNEEELKKTIVLPPSVIRDPEINIKKEVKAGNLDEYAKPTQDILPLHQSKVYTYCDDMEPEIRAGEPVLVRLLPSGIPVVPGEMYFVDMPSGGKIRYVEKEVEGKLYLKARNSAYGDIIIDRSEVQSLWSVVLILRTPRSMSMKEATAQELLANKDKHLDRLLEQLDKGGDRERMLIEHLLNNK